MPLDFFDFAHDPEKSQLFGIVRYAVRARAAQCILERDDPKDLRAAGFGVVVLAALFFNDNTKAIDYSEFKELVDAGQDETYAAETADGFFIHDEGHADAEEGEAPADDSFGDWPITPKPPR